MPRTMFFLYICQNSILKSNEIQLYTGALCILLASEYSNTYFSNAILKCQPFLFRSLSYIHMPQDTDGSIHQYCNTIDASMHVPRSLSWGDSKNSETKC